MEFDGRADKTEGDYRALETLLKFDIIKADSVEQLVEKGKIKIEGTDKLIEKYRDRDANNIEDKAKEELDKITSTTTTAPQGA